MAVIWGLVLVGLGLLAWLGQIVSWLAPATAVRLSLAETEDKVDPVYWADVRGEAIWDAFTLWTMPLAGVLLIAGQEAWAWFGLIGGGMYLYFAGRGVLTRVELHRRGHRIGEPADVRLGIAVLTIWGVAALITILVATADLA